jgi:hypothetical protein
MTETLDEKIIQMRLLGLSLRAIACPNAETRQ